MRSYWLDSSTVLEERGPFNAGRFDIALEMKTAWREAWANGNPPTVVTFEEEIRSAKSRRHLDNGNRLPATWRASFRPRPEALRIFPVPVVGT